MHLCSPGTDLGHFEAGELFPLKVTKVEPVVVRLVLPHKSTARYFFILVIFVTKKKGSGLEGREKGREKSREVGWEKEGGRERVGVRRTCM